MTGTGLDCAQPTDAGADKRTCGALRPGVRVMLGVVIALGCGELLVTVWNVAGDENRRRTNEAVRALERARTPAQRIEAIQDLARAVASNGTVAIPYLMRSLDDPAPSVRVEATRSIGLATSAAAANGTSDDLVQAAITTLTRSLDDEEPSVRIATVHTLGAIAASRSPSRVIQPQTLVNTLSAMLDDPDETVRASTIVSLGVAGPAAAPDPPRALFAALNDESSFNRAAAAHTLARFGPQRGD